MMGISFRYVKNRDDAMILVNEGFLKIVTNLEKWKEDTPFEYWAKRVMINTCIDNYRKQKKVRDHEEMYDDVRHFENDISIDYNEVDKVVETEQLDEMLSELPEVHAKVFNLYEIDGYNHKEIGKLLGISERSSKRHLAASRRKLQEMVKGLGNQLKRATKLF